MEIFYGNFIISISQKFTSTPGSAVPLSISRYQFLFTAPRSRVTSRSNLHANVCIVGTVLYRVENRSVEQWVMRATFYRVPSDRDVQPACSLGKLNRRSRPGPSSSFLPKISQSFYPNMKVARRSDNNFLWSWCHGRICRVCTPGHRGVGPLLPKQQARYRGK